MITTNSLPSMELLFVLTFSAAKLPFFRYVDCTLGGGGHSLALLEKLVRMRSAHLIYLKTGLHAFVG